ncbi:malto-oligosyltrehalose trehalohydrolase [Azoarcus sp. PA01]|nr:malto-oligosyltrehalose trehalohydrolase [Azoarcus sp. PA01]
MTMHYRDTGLPGRESPELEYAGARPGGASHAGTSHHIHRMPFGPERIDEHDERAGYRFRLWAPATKHVELCLFTRSGAKHYVTCAKSEGWHTCRVVDARAGDLYMFRLDGQLEVPDPASRFNPHDVHGPSLLVDPRQFKWEDGAWHGRPWHEAVVYELHVGTFTPEGRYDAAERKLPELARLGVTAIELMPLADFPGRRGWGYDGVLPFAPDAAYGSPDELKRFVQSAHRLGLMVLLDVVYNHFGPDGNYLQVYTPQFFTTEHATPWGGAIAFDGVASATVREFFIHNALYWLEEYRFDGLRLDAVQSIFDASPRHILEELSMWVRARATHRRLHLVLEHVDNEASRLGAPQSQGTYDAQWNDDFHHAAHVLLTGERDGYYADYADHPVRHLVRCLAEGFAYQGELSPFHGRPRGEPSAALPPTGFVNFLQNHDQVGNRAFGERLVTLAPPDRLRAVVALQLLAPSPPLLFMGEEAGATTPFLYFCDYQGELATAVREGRKREFAGFEHFSAAGGNENDGEGVHEIPDPCAEAMFLASKLDWSARESEAGQRWLSFYRELLGLRHEFVVPRVPQIVAGGCTTTMHGDAAFEIRWPCTDGAALVLRANLADAAVTFDRLDVEPFAALGPDADDPRQLAPCSVRAYVVLPGGVSR